VPTFNDVQEAARRIDGVAHRTPVIISRTLDARARAHVVLKAENFQRGGSFKFRGAYNKISTLDSGKREGGVAAYSSGNHAQAVALAGRLLGARATIVMPEDTPPIKLDATRAYGAEVIFYDRYAQDREAVAEQLASERGLTLIPPYEDPLVMSGQGTAALELFEEAGTLDALFVPVGGGGLMAGCSTVAKHIRPSCRVVGVEPEAGDDTKRSLEAGHRIEISVPRTIADGQQASIPGELTFEVNRRNVDEIITVSDEEIVEAMAFAFDYLKIVLEPSGASALAVVLRRRGRPAGENVGVILSGGNVGARRFADLLAALPHH
jgi:threonine dehydratase